MHYFRSWSLLRIPRLVQTMGEFGRRDVQSPRIRHALPTQRWIASDRVIDHASAVLDDEAVSCGWCIDWSSELWRECKAAQIAAFRPAPHPVAPRPRGRIHHDNRRARTYRHGGA